MKRILPLYLTWILLTAFVLMAQRSPAQGSVSFQVFYDQLSPYGSWVNYDRYGYVWIPTAVSAGFRPYGSSGHWVFTADGWTWISDYSWGWAPFHYGNWFYDDAYGWMWVPGYDWAPAWVTWGEYGGNYGWAPVGPDVQIGVAWNTYRPPAYYWTFVPRAYIGSSLMNRHYVHYSTNVTVVNQITVINNINTGNGRPRYMRGPDVRTVEKYTHAPVRTVNVRESARPGRGRVQNGQVSLYRPAVSRTQAARPAAPTRVRSVQNLRPATLPGYNRQARPSGQPAQGRAAARPAVHPPQPASQQRTPVPAHPPAAGPAQRTERPVRENHPPQAAGRRPATSPHPAPQLTPHQPATVGHPENRPPATPAPQQTPQRPVPAHPTQPRHAPHPPAQPRPPAPPPQARPQERTPEPHPAAPENRPPERKPR